MADDQERPLDKVIRELRDSDPEEDSQVNVVVHAAKIPTPPPTMHRSIAEGFAGLPPWGKVIVLLAAIGAMTFAGFAGFSIADAVR